MPHSLRHQRLYSSEEDRQAIDKYQVYFHTPDGCTLKIHPEFAKFFQSFLSKNVGIGSSPTNPIPVPKRVDKTTLELILLYFKGRIVQPENVLVEQNLGVRTVSN